MNSLGSKSEKFRNIGAWHKLGILIKIRVAAKPEILRNLFSFRKNQGKKEDILKGRESQRSFRVTIVSFQFLYTQSRIQLSTTMARFSPCL